MIDKYALIQRSVFQLDVVPLFPIYAAVMNASFLQKWIIEQQMSKNQIAHKHDRYQLPTYQSSLLSHRITMRIEAAYMLID